MLILSQATTSILLMCALVLANLLVLMDTLDDIHLWLQRGRMTRALYKANGICKQLSCHFNVRDGTVLQNRLQFDQSVSLYY